MNQSINSSFLIPKNFNQVHTFIDQTNNNNNSNKKKNSWWKTLNLKFKRRFKTPNKKYSQQQNPQLFPIDSISSNNNNYETDNCNKNNNNNLIKLYNKNYFFYVKETHDGFKINLNSPYLISIIEFYDNNNATNIDNYNNSLFYNDEKTLIKIFPLNYGCTKIGSSDTNDIIINSPDIESKHCYINYNHFNNEVILYPLCRLCSVDGVLVDKAYPLKLGILSLKLVKNE